eukprot:1161629-Pelagomonas_calceolata.AAC.1
MPLSCEEVLWRADQSGIIWSNFQLSLLARGRTPCTPCDGLSYEKCNCERRNEIRQYMVFFAKLKPKYPGGFDPGLCYQT